MQWRTALCAAAGPHREGAGHSPSGETQLVCGRRDGEQRARQCEPRQQSCSTYPSLIPGDLVLLSCGRGWPFCRIRPSTAGTQTGAAPNVTAALTPCPSEHCHQRPDTEPAAARERLLLLAEGTAQPWTRSIGELTTPAWLHFKASHCWLSLWCQHTFGGQKISPTMAPSSGLHACPERNKGENTAGFCWSLRSLASR